MPELLKLGTSVFEHIQKAPINHLLRARHCTVCWGYISGQDRHDFLDPHRTHSLVGGHRGTKDSYNAVRLSVSRGTSFLQEMPGKL